MKITFEGDIHDIIAQMEKVFALVAVRAIVKEGGATQGPSPVPESLVEKPVLKPVEKPLRTAKQLENDERLRGIALAKIEAKRAAKAASSEQTAAAIAPALAKAQVNTPKAPFDDEPSDPAKIVQIRQKTIEDLQAAYANGHQQEVFELLSRFGNGAKSFRELPPEAFVPIREAIDKGALT